MSFAVNQISFISVRYGTDENLSVPARFRAFLFSARGENASEIYTPTIGGRA